MELPFWKRKKTESSSKAQLRERPGWGTQMSWDQDRGMEKAYESCREKLPILDAAITKLVRLTGGFTLKTGSEAMDQALARDLRTLSCGHGCQGADNFLAAYLDSLITYGRAVGEMVVRNGQLSALLWGDVTKVRCLESGDPTQTLLASAETLEPYPRQELLLFSVLNPEAAHPYGVSLLRGLPFYADALETIYRTITRNWERAGDVRYSVVCKPDGSGSAQDRTRLMAQEWAKAMSPASGGSVTDFVAVGDVEIRVIGSDAQILDPEVPVRQLLEQVVAKTGLPPFLLGLSWATTERMSKQQADLLTSELWALRRAVEPVLSRIGSLWMHLHGLSGAPEIEWTEISLQDLTEEAHADLYHAQADRLRLEQEKG